MSENKPEENEERHNVDVWRKADLQDYIMMELENRVKRDNPTKKSVFYTALSRHSKDPINLFLKGPSGVGKTFNTMETLKCFPQDKIWYLYGLTRKSLVHDTSAVLMNADGEPFEYQPMAKPRRKDHETEESFKEALTEYYEQVKQQKEELRKAYYFLDLTGVLIVFMDAPDFQVFSNLKPILSHDKFEAEFKFVDRLSSRAPMQTIRVRVHGWPATIFLTTDREYIEEFATRGFTVTPESSAVKFLEANTLTTFKNSMPWIYNVETPTFRTIMKLLERIEILSEQESTDVFIPFLNLHEIFPHEIARDMRDYAHFCQLIKNVTLLHYFQRPYMKTDGKKFLVATLQDIRESLILYREVFETTRTGTEQRILDFYHDVLTKPDKDNYVKNEWYLREATKAYNETAAKPLSEESIRQWMDRLDQIGYVNTEKAKDLRKNLYVLLKKDKPEAEISKITIESDFGLILQPKLIEGFKTWIKKCPNDLPFHYMKNFDATRWGEADIDLHELANMVIGEEATAGLDLTAEKNSYMKKVPVLVDFVKPQIKPEVETKAEIEQTDENRRILDKSAKSEHNEHSGVNFLWKSVPPGEKCELCGEFVVEYEINDIRTRETVRRCEACFHRMRNTYRNAIWKEEVSQA